MSTSDYLDGISYAQARARKVRGDANVAIAEWRTYSDHLLSKLKAAELAAIKNGAQLAGRDAQQQALRQALTALDPAHPLLALLPQLGNAARVKYLADHGYKLDVASGQVTPAEEEPARSFEP